MGNQTSTRSVKSHPDAFVAISICTMSKIRVMNASPDVVEMLTKLDKEVLAKCGIQESPIMEYYGTIKMKVGDRQTFEPRRGKKSRTLGTWFVVRLLEEMFKLRYDLVTSSDLAKTGDNATLFFNKSVVRDEDRTMAKVCCIAPGGKRFGTRYDRLNLIRTDVDIKQAVMLAIGDTSWAVEDPSHCIAYGEDIHEIAFDGTWGGTHQDGINTRKVICDIAGRMGGLNWRLLSASNLNGTSDAFFFIYDPSFTSDSSEFCMIALSKSDRIRLINCDHLAAPLKGAAAAAGSYKSNKN